MAFVKGVKDYKIRGDEEKVINSESVFLKSKRN